jgi:hypothetical protein
MTGVCFRVCLGTHSYGSIALTRGGLFKRVYVQQILRLSGISDVCSQLVKLLFKDKLFVMCFLYSYISVV